VNTTDPDTDQAEETVGELIASAFDNVWHAIKVNAGILIFCVASLNVVIFIHGCAIKNNAQALEDVKDRIYKLEVKKTK